MTTEEENNELEKEYLETFNEKEKQAYLIAKTHLGMSFDLSKSIGYNDWKKKRREINLMTFYNLAKTLLLFVNYFHLLNLPNIAIQN